MDHPIRLINQDDLQRTRLTVFFRLILVIPHLIVLAVFGLVAYIVAFLNWWATLFMGQCPASFHNFQAMFVRYSTNVSGYYHLLGDPYPPFGGGPYAIDLEIAGPLPQRRLFVFLRLIWAIPALILNYVLNLLLNVITLFAWFVCLFTGKMPEGLENLGSFVVRYQAQTLGYVLLLTETYPSLSTEELNASQTTAS